MNLKLTDKIKQQPSGKGATPHTEKQAAQWAYMDSITTRWRFPRPLVHSQIERFCKDLTGEIRGIPLGIWEEAIDYCNERVDLTNPVGYLKEELKRRLNK